MKTLMLITICVITSCAISHAQQDTTKTRIQGTQPVQPTQPQAIPQPSQQLNNQNNLSGWTPVSTPQIPDNLRQTLTTTPELKGWENGTIYTNQSNGGFQLRTNTSNGTTGVNNNSQVYYFDKDGKIITKPNDH